jgi:hypothetical protein
MSRHKSILLSRNQIRIGSSDAYLVGKNLDKFATTECQKIKMCRESEESNQSGFFSCEKILQQILMKRRRERDIF